MEGCLNKEKSQKKIYFIRSTWHQAIVVNTWRTKINPNTKINCPSCSFGMVKSIVHTCWLYLTAKKAQKQPFFLIYQFTNLSSHIPNIWKALNLEQCLFNKWLLIKLQKYNSLWTLLRSMTLWSNWIGKNDIVFNGNRWHVFKLKKVMWEGFKNDIYDQ